MPGVKFFETLMANDLRKGDAILAAAEASGDFTDEQRAEHSALSGRVDANRKSRDEAVANELAAQPVASRSSASDDLTHAGNGTGRTGVTLQHDNEEDRPWGSRTGAPFGEMLQAIHAATNGGPKDSRLMAAALGSNEAVGSDGGFLVGTDIANDIMITMTDGAILSRVRRIPLSAGSNGIRINVVDETSRVTGSRFGGVQGYWLPEAGSKTASRPTFAQIELRLKKLAALGYSTDELLQDAVALQNVMTTAFAEELKFLLEDAIYEGDGAGKPLGILNAPALVTVAKETAQAAATIVPENIVNMFARLAPKSRANAVWLVNPQVEAQFPLMTLAAGLSAVPVYMPPGGLRDSQFGNLLGRPVIANEYSAALGTVGDIILADLNEYGIIDRGGIQQNSSIHVAFATDETAFRAVYRVDGQPLWRSAVTPFKGSATTSPYVALATRA